MVNWQRTRCAGASTGLDLGGMIITDSLVPCFSPIYSDANTLHDTHNFHVRLYTEAEKKKRSPILSQINYSGYVLMRGEINAKTFPCVGWELGGIILLHMFGVLIGYFLSMAIFDRLLGNLRPCSENSCLLHPQKSNNWTG